MDQQSYIIIKQYLGLELLKYALNYDEGINLDIEFSKLFFNENQLQALKILDNFIRDTRISFINQGGFGDGFGHHAFIPNYRKNIFNDCRVLCNGKFPNLQQEDEILTFIQSIAIAEYPNFLIKSSGQRGNFFSNFAILNISQMEEFSSLIKEDILNNLTNNKNGIDHFFQFNTSYNLKINTQVWNACSIIISKSFENCCKKMKYTLNNLLIEIADSLENLRALAKGEMVKFSLFIGVQGIICQNLSDIELSDCILRAIDSHKNPGIQTNLVAAIHSDNSGQYISGGIIEIKYLAKAQPSTDPTNYGLTIELIKYAENCFENISFALCFSLDEDYAFIQKFVENGFPLLTPGNYSWNEKLARKYIKITDNNITDIKDWYKRLSNIDKQDIYVPLKRLNYAIYERMSAEDSITDAIIAWEGMFSEAFETTFKVTGSIAKFLKLPHERKEYLRRLKDLYDLRSDIVHGKVRENKSLLYKEDKEHLRSEVIKIGLECLKKLTADPELLKMSPSERIKKILVFT